MSLYIKNGVVYSGGKGGRIYKRKATKADYDKYEDKSESKDITLEGVASSVASGISKLGNKIFGKKKKKNIVGRNKGGIISKDYRKGGMIINTQNNKRNR
mgnify:CR=1 FL=1